MSDTDSSSERRLSVLDLMPKGPVFPAAVVVVAGLVFCMLRFGEDGGKWPLPVIALFPMLLFSPMYVWDWDRERKLRRDLEEWFSDLEDAHPKDFQLPPSPSPFTVVPWALGGVLLAGAIGAFIARQPEENAMKLGALAFGMLSPMFAIFASYLSPQARYVRSLSMARDKLHEIVMKRERRERVAARQALELKWPPRLTEALYWWNTHGARLNSDDPTEAVRYLEDHVRVNGQALLAKKDSILRAFNDERDPCATTEAAAEMARWAVANKAELLSDRLANAPDRTTEGLTYILRAHHRRDYLVLTEADPAHFAHAARERVPLKKNESPDELYRRLATDCDSLLAFKAREIGHIDELAGEIPPDQRDDWKRSRTELLLLVVTHELRRRMEAAQ